MRYGFQSLGNFFFLGLVPFTHTPRPGTTLSFPSANHVLPLHFSHPRLARDPLLNFAHPSPLFQCWRPFFVPPTRGCFSTSPIFSPMASLSPVSFFVPFFLWTGFLLFLFLRHSLFTLLCHFDLWKVQFGYRSRDPPRFYNPLFFFFPRFPRSSFLNPSDFFYLFTALGLNSISLSLCPHLSP